MGRNREDADVYSLVLDLDNWSGNLKVFLNDLDKMERAERDLVKSSDRMEDATQKKGRALEFVSRIARRASPDLRRMGDTTERAGRQAQSASRGISSFTERLIQIDAAIRIVDRAVRAVGQLAEGVENLSQRAARVDAITATFQNVSGSQMEAARTLSIWREQAQGAISDLELMRLGNVALLGVSEELSEVVTENYGTAIAGAFRIATARGLEFEEVLDKFTRGIRLRSRLLVDDLGVFVDATEANERYAESHGLITSQLTENQRAAAWAAEAFRQLEVSMAQSALVGVTSMQQASAQWQNTLDRLASATQEGAMQMDAGLGMVSSGIAGFVDRAAPYFGILADEIGAALLGIGQRTQDFYNQLDPEAFFLSGARIIAALAEGIASGARYVVEAVNVIATVISNFLMGLSPPREGPLSTIDIGGRNLIEAWISQFDAVSLDPAERLAGNVNDILMSIAGLETRDQVTIVEQLSKRIEKRLEGAVSALSRGRGDEAEVQALDQQRAMIAEQLDLLKEREALERAGLKFQDDGVELARLRALENERAAQAARAESGERGRSARAEKDRLQELREQLQLNRRLQEEYNAAGIETNDLVRQELNLQERIAEELTSRGLDPGAALQEVSRIQEAIELEREKSRQRAGGRAATGIPELDEMLEGAGFLPGAELPPGVIPTAGEGQGMGFAAQLRTVFSGAEEAMARLEGSWDELQATISGIDFGNVNAFLDRLQEMPPEQVFAELANLFAKIIGIPADIVVGLSDLFTDLTGIDIPPGVVDILGLIITIATTARVVSTLAGVGTSIAGWAASAITAAGPLGLIAVILGTIIFAVNRFGSVENTLEEAFQTFVTLANIVAIALDDVGVQIRKSYNELRLDILEEIARLDEIAERVGIDLVPDAALEFAINQVELEQAAIEARDNVHNTAQRVIAGDLDLDPVALTRLRMGVESGAIEVSQRTVGLLLSALRDAINEGDEAQVVRLARLAVALDANAVGMDPEVAREIERQMQAGNLDLTARPGILIDPDAENIQVSENAIRTWEQRVTEAFGGLSIDPFTSVDPETGEELAVGGVSIPEWMQAPDISQDVWAGSWRQSGANAASAYLDGVASEEEHAMRTYDALARVGADRLAGQSPPPVGPLSTIDVGGMRVVEAWLAAWENADLTPIQGFASRVTGLLVGAATEGGESGAVTAADAAEGGSILDALMTFTAGVVESVQTTQATMTTYFDMADERFPLYSGEVTTATDDTNAWTGALESWIASALVADVRMSASVIALGGWDNKVLESTGIVDAFADSLGDVVSNLREIVSAANEAQGLGMDLPFGGGRAGGGPVEPGRIYRVGEQGPEWFIPAMAGMIANRMQMDRLLMPPVIVNNITVLPAPVMVDGSRTTNYNLSGSGGLSRREIAEMANWSRA